jgi:Predicted transcriptional regulators
LCYDVPKGSDIVDINSWRTQLKKGFLEYSILHILQQQDSYGYLILSKLNEYALLATTESTVYPILRKLQKSGYLAAEWRDAEQEGLPPRKYYTLTDLGKAGLKVMEQDWDNLKTIISKLEMKG